MDATQVTRRTPTFADVTGLLAAGTPSLVGFLLVPARRRLARRQLQEQVSAVRATLMSRVGEAFAREASRSLEGLGEALGPYARFVRAERERRESQRREIDGLAAELLGLRARVEAIA